MFPFPQGRNGADPVPFILRYDYKIAREYNWNVKNKASKGYEENYFFIFREGDGVYYNELETRYSAQSYLTKISLGLCFRIRILGYTRRATLEGGLLYLGICHMHL